MASIVGYEIFEVDTELHISMTPGARVIGLRLGPRAAVTVDAIQSEEAPTAVRRLLVARSGAHLPNICIMVAPTAHLDAGSHRFYLFDLGEVQS